MMVSERLRRRCYTVAETPEAADRLVREWQEYTGQNATRAADQHTFGEAAADREAQLAVASPQPYAATGWRDWRARSTWETRP